MRLVTAGLAARLKFTVDDIEDLKIAVDELTAYLTGREGKDGRLEVDFHVYEDRIEISGRGVFSPGHNVRTQLTELSKMILDTVVDAAGLQQEDGVPSFSVVKSRRS